MARQFTAEEVSRLRALPPEAIRGLQSSGDLAAWRIAVGAEGDEVLKTAKPSEGKTTEQRVQQLFAVLRGPLNDLLGLHTKMIKGARARLKSVEARLAAAERAAEKIPSLEARQVSVEMRTGAIAMLIPGHDRGERIEEAERLLRRLDAVEQRLGVVADVDSLTKRLDDLERRLAERERE
jgi:hypothetical protein